MLHFNLCWNMNCKRQAKVTTSAVESTLTSTNNHRDVKTLQFGINHSGFEPKTLSLTVKREIRCQENTNQV